MNDEKNSVKFLKFSKNLTQSLMDMREGVELLVRLYGLTGNKDMMFTALNAIQDIDVIKAKVNTLGVRLTQMDANPAYDEECKKMLNAIYGSGLSKSENEENEEDDNDFKPWGE